MTASTTEVAEFDRFLDVCARPVEFSAHDTVLLTASDSWFVVRQGSVDAFAVSLDGEEIKGAWRPLGTLGAGVVLVAPKGVNDRGVLLRRINDAQIVELPSATAQLSQHQRVWPQLARGVDEAIIGLQDCLLTSLPPRDFVPLTAGRTEAITSRQSGRPVDPVVWAEVSRGEVCEGGMPEGEVRQGDTVALTRQSWVTTNDEALLTTSSTLHLLESSRLSDVLGEHYCRYVRRVGLVEEAQAKATQRHIHLSQMEDSSYLSRARDSYDALLARDDVSSDTLGDFSDSPGVVAAARRVLVYLGEDDSVPEALTLRNDINDFGTLSDTNWVRTRSIRLEGDWWNAPVGPLVGMWGPQRLPVAYIPDGSGYLAVSDALEGPLRVTSENRHLAGREAWYVYPSYPQGVTTMRGVIASSFSAFRGEFWLFLAMAVLVGALGLITPIVNGEVLGSYVPAANRPMIVQGGLAVVLAALAGGAFALVQNLTVLRLRGGLTAAVQTKVWMHLLSLPVTFFRQYSTGKLATIILSVKGAQDALSGILVAAVLGMFVAVANTAILFFYSPRLGVVALGLMVFAAGLFVVVARRVYAVERVRFAEQQRLQSLSFEILTAMSKIRAAAAEERAFERWVLQQRKYQQLSLDSRRLQDKLTVFNAGYPMLSLCVVYVVVCVTALDLPLSSLIAFLTAFTLAMNALMQFSGAALGAISIAPMLQSLRPVLNAEAESGPGRAFPGDLSGHVSLDNVAFRYGQEGPLVLDDVSIEARPGECVAIVGPSGSGKSSVVRLLLGFEEASAGSVNYDGQDLRDLDLSAVRSQCGVVLQGGALSSGDIRSNITSGGEFTEADVWEAVDAAGLRSDIENMPMGLATVVNDNAVSLSGGQVQRLMIARALINKPRIVIFDEATSALDAPTQRIVARATHHLNATRIVIAHRLSTIRDADRIYVLDRGKVVQVGSFDELVADTDGLFAALCAQQVVGAVAESA